VQNQLSDKDLLAMCQSGNESGFAQLYHRYAKKIFNSIYRILSNQEESEDILQETFVDFFSRSDKWHSVLSVEAWLRRMGVNKAISLLRKNKQYFTPVDDLEIQDDGEDELLEKEWRECRLTDLENVIDQLTGIPKMVVNLYLFEDMSHDEVAETLGMTAVAVRSQYHRAKKKIYEQLKERYNYAG
jgi:RNA polymerase sigma-70 factor (ECF subfamily)